MKGRVLRFVPVLLVLVGAFAVTVLSPSAPPDGALTFTLDGNGVSAPIEPAVIRRRTITPEFDPPLDLRGGRVIVARGFVACDPGEIFRVEVVVTQDGARGEGRTAGRCTGEVQVWTAPVTGRGRARFTEGPVHACAVATTIRRGVTDRFEWCGDPVVMPVGN